MAKLDGRVRERARHFIDRFKDRRACEFVQEFAVPFPVTIFLDLLDFPQEEMKQFLEWENVLLLKHPLVIVLTERAKELRGLSQRVRVHARRILAALSGGVMLGEVEQLMLWHSHRPAVVDQQGRTRGCEVRQIGRRSLPFGRCERRIEVSQ